MDKFKNNSIINAIGNTPIIRLQNVAKHIESEIYVKLEYLNPGGSIKDRMGVYMCQKAVEKGDLKPGGTIIECTSGNTGIGIALYANTHGYKTVFVMADKQSQEKIDNLKAFIAWLSKLFSFAISLTKLGISSSWIVAILEIL